MAPSATIINVNDNSGGLDNAATVTTATLGAKVTLRDAINAANNTGGSGNSYQINLQANTTYNLTTIDNYWYGPDGLPGIFTNITIQGDGAVIQRESSAPKFRLFYVSGGLDGPPPGSLTLENVTLEGGVAQGGSSNTGGGGLGAGGAIFNQGTLTLTGVTLTNNQAVGGSGTSGSGSGGGGMGQNASGTTGGGFGGPLNVPTGYTGSIGGSGGSGSPPGGGGGGGGFNTAAAGANGSGKLGGNGGGLGNFGGRGGGFVGATYSGDGGGGGYGTAGAYPGFGGGGFGFGGSASSSGNAGGGGGIGGGGGGGLFVAGGGGGGFGGGGGDGGFLDGGNGGFGGGGGGGYFSGAAGLGGFGGGTGGTSSSGASSLGGGGGGMGGGIFTMMGSLSLTNCTLTGNTAQGGSGHNGGSGYGGAIFNLDSNLSTTFCTLAANAVQGGTGTISSGNADGGAVYNLAYGNDINSGAAQSSTATITDSILANSSGGNDLANNVVNGANTNTATATLSGPNLVMTTSGTITGSATVTADPQLGPLQNNGGPTLTMAIALTSPAYLAGVPVSGVTTDQRGANRPNPPSLGAFEPAPATTTAANNGTTFYSESAQNVTLTADVSNAFSPVNEGTVTFTVLKGSKVIGTAATSSTVINGTASVTYTLPAGLGVGPYTIDAVYNPGPDFTGSSDDTHTLTVAPANVATTVGNVSTVYSVNTQSVTLHASVADTSFTSDIVNEGTVEFTIENGSTVVGSIAGTVSGDKASANFTLPAGLAAGSYTIAVAYSDSKGKFTDSSDTSALLTVFPAGIEATVSNVSTAYSVATQSVTLQASVTDTSIATDTVNEGTVAFAVTNGSVVIGSVVATVSSGTASANLGLPAGLLAGRYTITVSYTDSQGNFTDRGDTNGTLTVSPANITVTAANASASYSPNSQTVTLHAVIADTSFATDTVNEGTVTFAVQNGSIILGSASVAVAGGTASTTLSLPAGLTADDYTIAVSYSDSQDNFTARIGQSSTLTVKPANVVTTAIDPPAVLYSASGQSIALDATVADTTTPSDIVNEGSVLFTVQNGSTVVGSVAGAVSGDKASAAFTLPAGHAAGSYTIAVHYVDSPSNFVDSGDNNGALTVAPDNVAATANNASAVYSLGTQSVTLSASVANTSIPSQPVNEGAVTFAVKDGSTVLGSVVGAVSGGKANAAYTLPAGQSAGSYSIDVSYSDSQGNFSDNGDQSATLTVSPANVATTANNASAVYSLGAQNVTLSAKVVNTNIPSQTVSEGAVTFTVKDGSTVLGNVVGSVSGGVADATFAVPAGQAVGAYTITVSYSDSVGNFLDSSDQNAELVVARVGVATTANNVSTVYSTNTQTLTLSAAVASTAVGTVDEGSVTFVVKSGNSILGSVSSAVSGGNAAADFTLASGQAVGSYTIDVSYSDSKGNLTDSGDTGAALTVSPANVTVAAAPIASVVYSTNTQRISLRANVADVSVPSDTVDAGTVTFTLKSGSKTIGSVQGSIVGGTANAAVTLPAGLAVGSYTVAVSYADNQGNFSDSGDTGSVLTVTPANVTATPGNVSISYSPNAQTVTLNAVVADTSNSGDIVDEGTVTFTIQNGSIVLGNVLATVTGGTASAAFTLPAGLTAGSYAIAVRYSDGQGNFFDSGDQNATLTIQPIGVTTTAANVGTTFLTTAQTVTLSAAVAYPANPNTPVGEGAVTFTVENGSTIVGTAVAAVNGGTAKTAFTLHAGLAAGTYAIVVGYGGTPGNILDGGDTSGTLTIGATATTTQLTSATLTPNLMAQTTTETLSAHVGSSTAVTQGAVTFFLSGHTVTANVDGNGNATASVTLPMLDLLGPQSIRVSYNDAANNLTASSDAQTPAWQSLNAVLPSTATFTPRGQAITADLFGLFITYTNGLLTEIDFGSTQLVFLYSDVGQLVQATLDGKALLS